MLRSWGCLSEFWFGLGEVRMEGCEQWETGATEGTAGRAEAPGPESRLKLKIPTRLNQLLPTSTREGETDAHKASRRARAHPLRPQAHPLGIQRPDQHGPSVPVLLLRTRRTVALLNSQPRITAPPEDSSSLPPRPCRLKFWIKTLKSHCFLNLGCRHKAFRTGADLHYPLL